MWELRSSEVKLTFIPASALLAMRSIYIGQLLGPAAAPLIMRMHTRLGGVAMVCNYPHPAGIAFSSTVKNKKYNDKTEPTWENLPQQRRWDFKK